MIGKKHSLEARKRISEANKLENILSETIEKRRMALTGQCRSDETKKRMSDAQKGKNHSEESKRKMSEAKKGVKLPHTPEWNKKISEGQKGRTVSSETREKISLASKGRKHTEETKKKISQRNKGRIKSQETKGKISKAKTGGKNPNWKGGISKTKEYKNLMARIHGHKYRLAKRQRGNFTIKDWEELKIQYSYTCPICERKEPEISLTVDHVIPISKGGSNFIENIQPLCLKCNDSKNVKIFRVTHKGELKLF